MRTATLCTVEERNVYGPEMRKLRFSKIVLLK